MIELIFSILDSRYDLTIILELFYIDFLMNFLKEMAHGK